MGTDGDQREITPETVVEAIMRASRALMAVTARTLATVSEEVTLPQFRTLVVVATRGPQTVTALAEGLDVHASTMTRMCTRLVARGLVVREPSSIDRREVVIRLTPDGTTLVEEAMRRRREAFEAAVWALAHAERSALVNGLQTFADAAGNGMDSTTSMPADDPFISLPEAP